MIPLREKYVGHWTISDLPGDAGSVPRDIPASGVGSLIEQAFLSGAPLGGTRHSEPFKAYRAHYINLAQNPPEFALLPKDRQLEAIKSYYGALLDAGKGELRRKAPKFYADNQSGFLRTNASGFEHERKQAMAAALAKMDQRAADAAAVNPGSVQAALIAIGDRSAETVLRTTETASGDHEARTVFASPTQAAGTLVKTISAEEMAARQPNEPAPAVVTVIRPQPDATTMPVNDLPVLRIGPQDTGSAGGGGTGTTQTVAQPQATVVPDAPAGTPATTTGLPFSRNLKIGSDDAAETDANDDAIPDGFSLFGLDTKTSKLIMYAGGGLLAFVLFR